MKGKHKRLGLSLKHVQSHVHMPAHAINPQDMELITQMKRREHLPFYPSQKSKHVCDTLFTWSSGVVNGAWEGVYKELLLTSYPPLKKSIKCEKCKYLTVIVNTQ